MVVTKCVYSQYKGLKSITIAMKVCIHLCSYKHQHRYKDIHFVQHDLVGNNFHPGSNFVKLHVPYLTLVVLLSTI